MKNKYLKAPVLSTGFSENEKSAKNRFSNILNKKGSAKVIVIIVLIVLIITIGTGIKILLNSNSIRKTFSITYPSRRTQRIHMDFRQDFKQKQSIIFR